MTSRHSRIEACRVFVGAVVLAWGLSACNPASRIDTGKLEQTFQGADAAVKTDVTQTVTAIKKGDLQAAVAPLKRVIQSGKMDDPQKDAVSGVITSLQMVIAQHSGKYSVDLYNSVSDLAAYVDGREPMVKGQ